MKGYSSSRLINMPEIMACQLPLICPYSNVQFSGYLTEHVSSAECGSPHPVSRTGDRGSPPGRPPAEGDGSRFGTRRRDLESQIVWAAPHHPDSAGRQTDHQDIGCLAGHYDAGRSARPAWAAAPLTRELFTGGVEQHVPL